MTAWLLFMFDIVIVSTMSRPAMLQQAIHSIADNSVHHAHTVTLSLDDPEDFPYLRGVTTILNTTKVGASRARNIGASSIPKYIRQKYVMFVDDDIYACPQWDSEILRVLESCADGIVVSGHAHPFNHHIEHYSFNGTTLYSTNVLSTVQIAMSWTTWDQVGYWVEPGGPGGSEDVDWCKRATDMGIGLVVTDPQCVLHVGLTSSTGKQIVGYDLMVQQNEGLIKHYGLEGKVHFK